MNSPKVSIIIPVYNVEKYIRKCFDSIINQKFTSYEVIIIDDGSKDSSGEICDEYCDRDSRFKVYHLQNQGAGKARNSGLDNAIGEYVFFVDADDWLEEKSLENHVNEIQYVDMVIGCSRNYYFKDEELKYSKIEYYSPANRYLDKDAVRNMYVDIAVNGVSHAPHNKMYKKSIIDRYLLRFPDYKKYEDLTFNNRYIDKIDSLSIIDEHSYNYRVNSAAGVAAKMPVNMFEIFTMVNEDLKKLLESWGKLNSNSKLKLKAKYITDIASCINDTYNPYLNYDYKKRYYYIKDIVNNKKVIEDCIDIDNSKFVNIISVLIKHKLIILIMIAYRIKFTLRKVLKNI